VRRPTTALLHALLTAVLVPLSASTAAAGTAGQVPTPVGACTDGSGVTVVVDFTDVGGEVEVGCAAGDPATGRQALTNAGFTATDASSGMICAINAAPDPCPETFKGSYWSYWSAEPGAAWTAYQVGADSSDPAPGGIEGWRYNDGTSGPSILPAAIQTATKQPTERSAEQPTEKACQDADPGPTPATLAGIAVGALLLVAAVLVARRRRTTSASRD